MKQKIGLECIILGKHKVIKRFLGMDMTSTVYIEEIKEI